MRLTAAIVIALVIPAYALAGPSIVGSMQAWDPADPAYDNLMANTFASSLTNPLYAENAAALYTWLLSTDDPNKREGDEWKT